MTAIVGTHTTIAGGLHNAIAHALKLGNDALQIFSRNPRGWTARRLTPEEVRLFRDARERSGLNPLVVHDCYLINLAAKDPFIHTKSVAAFRDEIERAVAIGADYLVTHPGSSKGCASDEEAIATCIDSIKQASRGLRLNGLTILIENTAGQGRCIGHRFEHVQAILEGCNDLPMGVCLDTAHTFAAGHDISTQSGLKKTIKLIDSAFGFERIKVIHCNDSKAPLGSNVDRHQHLGLGYIGLEGFRRIVNNSRFRHLPFILETPIDDARDDAWNVATLRGLFKRKGFR